MKRVPQPPVDRFARTTESHSAWLGTVLILLGLLVGFIGWGRITAVESLEGDPALETEVNFAMAHGGLQWVEASDLLKLPPELEQPPWAQAPIPTTPPPSLHSESLRFLRVNLAATDPCPT